MNIRYILLFMPLCGLFIPACQSKKSLINTTESTTSLNDVLRAYSLEDIPEMVSNRDTNPAWHSKEQKLLITGIVYQLDGKTPTPGVTIQYWQRNQKAPFSSHDSYHTGWVRTDPQGKYYIYTVRPPVSSSDHIPAFIHMRIKEPNLAWSYRIDDLYFDDDKLWLPYKKRNPPIPDRGGCGLLRIVISDEFQIAEHDIVLGLNIPEYPNQIQSDTAGLKIGEDQPSFMPIHVYGPDAGSRTCPVCKYGRYLGIIYFSGNNDHPEQIRQWISFLENESQTRQKYLKTYFVNGNSKNYSPEKRKQELLRLGNELKIQNTALTYVPSFDDQESEIIMNEIPQQIKNLVIIYRHRRIIDKYLNIEPSPENFKKITETLNSTNSEYFHLSSMH